MKQLQALDASIEKWQRVVYLQSLEHRCPLCGYNEWDCYECIISKITKESHCEDTPYYNTSIPWQYYSKKCNTNDNLMLSKLYEIRLEYINGYHKGIYE